MSQICINGIKKRRFPKSGTAVRGVDKKIYLAREEKINERKRRIGIFMKP